MRQMREAAENSKEIRDRVSNIVQYLFASQPNSEILLRSLEAIAVDVHVSGLSTALDSLGSLVEENRDQLEKDVIPTMHLFHLGRQSALNQVTTYLENEIKAR